MGKRLLGHANLWLNRRHRFNHSLFQRVIDHVASLDADLALFSGDVTTTSLADEFTDVVRYLKPLAERVPVVVVPGNHDRYTFRSARRHRMENALQGLIPDHFPYVRPLGERWHLLALDAAQPQIMLSRGSLGIKQFQAVAQYLSSLGPDEGVVVLCHYPAALPGRMPRSWMHDMAEARDLQQLLVDCPARVVFMHGHIHRPWVAAPNGDNRPPFTCINAGSPCLTSEAYPLGQGFWQITLPDDPADVIEAVHHVLRLPASSMAQSGPTIEPEHAASRWVQRRHNVASHVKVARNGAD